jgi:hypothetical protein
MVTSYSWWLTFIHTYSMCMCVDQDLSFSLTPKLTLVSHKCQLLITGILEIWTIRLKSRYIRSLSRSLQRVVISWPFQFPAPSSTHFPGSHYFISQQYHQSQQTQTYCKMKPTIAALFGVIAMACADHSKHAVRARREVVPIFCPRRRCRSSKRAESSWDKS